MIQRVPPAGVIERWQPALDRIAPRTTRGYSHLQLVWEPGEEWAPVGRWIVYEMVRPDRTYLGIQEDLMGPPPRAFGRYDWAEKRFKRYRSFYVSQRQWELHRQTGYFGKPVWVVQGVNGGHKRHWSDIEQTSIMMHTGVEEPPDPPAPGDLPYAEPDARTITALRGLDLVTRFGSLLHLIAHNDELRDSLDRREREVAKEMAEQVWTWLQTQVEESMLLTRAMVNEIWDHADPDKAVPDYDREYEDFINEVAAATPT